MSDMKSPPRGELLLESLAGIATDVAGRIFEEMTPDLMKLLGDEIATKFSDEWGGDTYYIPMGRVFRRSAIHRLIWERFTGDNVQELRREFGMSIQHIYRILARERERDRVERQARLPGVPE